MWIEGRAVYRRSKGALPRSVTVLLDVRGLTVRGLDGSEIATWPFASLVRQSAAPLVLGQKGKGERVEIADAATGAAFAAALKTVPSERDLTLSRSFALIGAALILFLLLGVGGAIWAVRAVADDLAPMIPNEVAEVIDSASVSGILDLLETDETVKCTAVDGTIALGRLADRLRIAGNARTMTLDILVYRSKVPNAVALPGGTVIVTSALIRRVTLPDAFAGVLAHEIGHVHYRHSMAQLIREGGLILALHLLTGDASGIAGGSVRLLLGAAFSRDAEREADAFSVEAVARAGGDPKSLGPFLMDIAGDDAFENGLLTLLSTHPLSSERAATIEALAADSSIAEGPLVTDEDWLAIRTMCD